jgi:hypothetical protein
MRIIRVQPKEALIDKTFVSKSCATLHKISRLLLTALELFAHDLAEDGNRRMGMFARWLGLWKLSCSALFHGEVAVGQALSTPLSRC